MEYPVQVQRRVDVLEDYEYNPRLEKFNILHMYPGELAYPNGFYDSRFFLLVGFNTNTMEKNELGMHDALNMTKRLDTIDPSVEFIRIFADGSTMIKFKEPVEVIAGQAATVSGAPLFRY